MESQGDINLIASLIGGTTEATARAFGVNFKNKSTIADELNDMSTRRTVLSVTETDYMMPGGTCDVDALASPEEIAQLRAAMYAVITTNDEREHRYRVVYPDWREVAHRGVFSVETFETESKAWSFARYDFTRNGALVTG
jgi:hypothetical protein